MLDAGRPTGFCPKCGYPIDPGRCPECGTVVAKPRRKPRPTWGRRVLTGAAVLAVISGGAAVWHYRTPLAIRYWPHKYLRAISDGEGPLARWASDVYWQQARIALGSILKATDSREQKIRAEMASLRSHNWAGKYHAIGGIGGGPILLLAPNAGFVFRESSCMWSSWNHGEIVSVTPERIVLRPAIDPDTYGVGPDRELVRVAWRGNKYLIEAREMPDFLNNLNKHESATPVWHMHREGDETICDDSWPELPPEYARSVFREPLRAHAVRVGRRFVTPRDPTCPHVIVTLDVGDRDGVYKGMVLYPVDHDAVLGATVTTLRDADCDADFSDCFDAGEVEILPRPGWEFSSVGGYQGLYEDFGFMFDDCPMRRLADDSGADEGSDNADAGGDAVTGDVVPETAGE